MRSISLLLAALLLTGCVNLGQINRDLTNADESLDMCVGAVQQQSAYIRHLLGLLNKQGL